MSKDYSSAEARLLRVRALLAISSARLSALEGGAIGATLADLAEVKVHIAALIADTTMTGTTNSAHSAESNGSAVELEADQGDSYRVSRDWRDEVLDHNNARSQGPATEAERKFQRVSSAAAAQKQAAQAYKRGKKRRVRRRRKR